MSNALDNVPAGWPQTELKAARWWPFQNTDSSITIPAHGVVAVCNGFVSGHGPDDSADLILKGIVPGTSGNLSFGINGPTEVGPQQYGKLTFDPAPAVFDDTVDDYVADVWGPKTGVAAAAANCKMYRGYPGFEVAFSQSTSTTVRFFRKTSRPAFGSAAVGVSSSSLTGGVGAGDVLTLGTLILGGDGYEPSGSGRPVELSSNRLLFNTPAYINASFCVALKYDSTAGFISLGSYESSIVWIGLEKSTDGGSTWARVGGTSYGRGLAYLGPTYNGALAGDDVRQVVGLAGADQHSTTLIMPAGSYLRLVSEVANPPSGGRTPYSVYTSGGSTLMVQGVPIFG